MIDWILEKIREAGIEDVHLVTNSRFAADFERWAQDTGVHVHDDERRRVPGARSCASVRRKPP